jgi:WD40 repeat protein
MPRIFISHSTQDRGFVEGELRAALAQPGVETWYAKTSIRTAESWDRSILDGLKSCDWFLVVMSPRSAQSEWVRDEVQWAVEHRPGKIIPVLMETCDVREVHFRLARIQYVDFRQDLAEARAELLRVLGIGTAPVATEAPAPAEDGAQLLGHQGPILSLAVSPDGRFAVSGAMDKTMRLWDIQGKSEIGQFPGHEGNVNCVAFSPNGRHALSGDGHYKARVWDVANRKMMCLLQGHVRAVISVAFSPDGKLAVSGGKDGTVRLWEIATGREIFCVEGHTEWICKVGFFPQGDRIYSSGQDFAVRLWDLEGKDVGRLALAPRPVLGVALSPNGKWFATAAEEKEIRLFDAADGKQLRVFHGHHDFVKGVAFSPSGRKLLSGSFDRTVRLWDVAAARELACFSGHTREVACVAYSPDGKLALSGALDSTLRIWDL